ncbi:MAG: hypothetical protein DMG00_01540 [Acidobacteria bacterium]|nr:MAG: hypothetical protein DMG00_01540 [Acidobacteriota bacterium]
MAVSYSAMDPAIRLLRDLVAINSVNPTLVPGAPGEQQVADAIAIEMRRIGLDVTVEAAAPGRPNVVGVLEGRSKGRAMMFCGHTDTVGVAGMSDPFNPVERDGRLYGRGAQDMKAGVAAMIDAARVVAQRRLESGRLIIAAVVDEEHRCAGAPLDRGCRDRHRAHRPRHRDRAQRLRVGRSRSAGKGGARQPADRRAGRDSPSRPCSRSTRIARSRAAGPAAPRAARHRIAACVIRRRGTGIEQLSGSRDAADGAADAAARFRDAGLRRSAAHRALPCRRGSDVPCDGSSTVQPTRV